MFIQTKKLNSFQLVGRREEEGKRDSNDMWQDNNPDMKPLCRATFCH